MRFIRNLGAIIQIQSEVDEPTSFGKVYLPANKTLFNLNLFEAVGEKG